MYTTTQVTTRTATRPTDSAPQRRSVWKHGVAAAVAASVTTTSLAAVASAAGVSFADSSGASIPIGGFAQLTLIFSLLGVGIAAVLAHRARRPRRTFLRTAVALTALSFVPDLTFGFDAASAATLISLHTVAAAIVVPTLPDPSRGHALTNGVPDRPRWAAQLSARTSPTWCRSGRRLHHLGGRTAPGLGHRRDPHRALPDARRCSRPGRARHFVPAFTNFYSERRRSSRTSPIRDVLGGDWRD
jgi:Family of unknown function (DUF6069)